GERHRVVFRLQRTGVETESTCLHQWLRQRRIQSSRSFRLYYELHPGPQSLGCDRYRSYRLGETRYGDGPDVFPTISRRQTEISGSSANARQTKVVAQE